jgi:hypothetical protein
MLHPLPFSESFKFGLSNIIDDTLRRIDFSKYGNEPNYTPAMISSLDGLTYEDEKNTVIIEGATMTSVSGHSAEPWAGADCSLVVTITGERIYVRKAVLIQAKRGMVEELSTRRRDELVEQIKDMQALTRHPKVLERV